MKEVVLHIGMHKTGSSAIQNSLRGYHNGLTEYANFEEENHSIPLYTIFSREVYQYHYWQSLGLTQQDIDTKRAQYRIQLDSILSDSTADRIIISGEDISTLSDPSQLDLLQYFADKGVKLSVVCFVRTPKSFAASALQELIKAGVGAFNTEILHPAYIKRLAVFTAHLPRERVIVRDYDSSLSESGDITKSFCHILGIHYDGEPNRTNETLSLTATRLLYRLNNLPISTTGSPQRLNARVLLCQHLMEAFPVANEGKIDKDEQLYFLDHTINVDLDFLATHFDIQYEAVTLEPDFSRAQDYLDDLSEEQKQRFKQYAVEQGLEAMEDESLDSLLIGFYSFILKGLS